MTTRDVAIWMGCRSCAEFPQPPVRQPFGWWSVFANPDGNRFALVPRG
jgi:predicted enzyme related to lactoylglutathione lyase